MAENSQSDCLYISSPKIRRTVASIDESVRRASDSFFTLDEFISLPDFGQHIILMYRAGRPPETIGEVDAFEIQLRSLVECNFWAMLLRSDEPSIYASYPLSELRERLLRLSPLVSHFPLPVSSSAYASWVQQDAEQVRSAIGGISRKIWEIEIPTQDDAWPVFRILGEGEGTPSSVQIGDQIYTLEFLALDDSFENLVKAYPLASKSSQSLIRYIYENTD